MDNNKQLDLQTALSVTVCLLSHYSMPEVCLPSSDNVWIVPALYTHFNNLTNKQKHDIILYGYKIDHDEYLYTNIKLTIAVQNYIVNTKRFYI